MLHPVYASGFSTRNNIADFAINLKKRHIECIAYIYRMTNLKKLFRYF